MAPSHDSKSLPSTSLTIEPTTSTPTRGRWTSHIDTAHRLRQCVSSLISKFPRVPIQPPVGWDAADFRRVGVERPSWDNVKRNQDVLTELFDDINDRLDSFLKAPPQPLPPVSICRCP
jgi:hypothetical protein